MNSEMRNERFSYYLNQVSDDLTIEIPQDMEGIKTDFSFVASLYTLLESIKNSTDFNKDCSYTFDLISYCFVFLKQNNLTNNINQEKKYMMEIIKAKGADYSGEEDSLGNFKITEIVLDIDASLSILVRMVDKVSRIYNLTKSGEAKVKDESLKDTVIDLINYAILRLLVIEDTNPDNFIYNKI